MKNAAIVLSALCLIVGVALSSYADSKRQIKKRSLQDSKKQIKKTDLTQKVPKLPPDLLISIDASHKAKAGEKIPHCKVVVTNVGKSTARGTSSAGSNGYMVDLVLSSNNHIPVGFAGYSPNFSDDVLLKGGRISNTPDLAPNQSKTFSLNNVLTIPNDTMRGGYCLGGIVDSGKKITEQNENNNTTCRKLRVKGKGQPDLIVSNIKTVKDCWVKVTVRNIGSSGLPDWVYSGPDMADAAIQLYNDGGPWGGMAIDMFDPAEKLKVPGGSVSKIWFKGSPGLELPPGTHTVKAVVDIHNKIDESNNSNNSLTRRLQCKDAEPPGIPLQVTNLRHSQDFELTSNNRIKITVEFNKNVNKSTLIPGSNFKVMLEGAIADGTLQWTNNRKLVWTSRAPFSDLCDFTPDCVFQLIINDTVTDTGNHKLDGDKDDTPGGNFTHIFTLLG